MSCVENSPSTLPVVVVDLEPVVVENNLLHTVVCSLDTDICQVCVSFKAAEDFIQFSGCGHSFCTDCVKKVFKMNVSESKVDVQCLRCTKSVSQDEIRYMLDEEEYQKYLGFTLRQYLAREAGVVRCSAPDCPFACISTPITSMSSSSPECEADSKNEENCFICLREGCGYKQCTKCKRVWHDGQTCEEFTRDHPSDTDITDMGLNGPVNVKTCPSCGITIEKLQDGSCNQVTCMVCRTRFCWLCGQEVSEMHFLSPSGCPLFGSEMWTSRKRCCCKFWLLFTAPLLIFLIALLSIPIVLIILPLFVGYQVYYKRSVSLHKCVRVTLTVLAVIVTIFLSPIVAVIVAVLVFPIGCMYFYVWIPVT